MDVVQEQGAGYRDRSVEVEGPSSRLSEHKVQGTGYRVQGESARLSEHVSVWIFSGERLTDKR